MSVGCVQNLKCPLLVCSPAGDRRTTQHGSTLQLTMFLLNNIYLHLADISGTARVCTQSSRARGTRCQSEPILQDITHIRGHKSLFAVDLSLHAPLPPLQTRAGLPGGCYWRNNKHGFMESVLSMKSCRQITSLRKLLLCMIS